MTWWLQIQSPLLYAIALMNIVLFVGLGVYSLHARFRRLDEWSLKVQLAALSLIVPFYFLQLNTLRLMLRGNPVFLIFSALGLFVAGLALYGHILVSVLSRMLLGIVSPEETGISDRPRLGPAEALEHHGDYANALNEYYVLARIYPDNPLINLRIATNLERLNRHEDALVWMERAFKNSRSPEECLILIRRIADIALDHLHKPERLQQAQEQFLKRFADHSDSKGIRKNWAASGLTPTKKTSDTYPRTKGDGLLDALEVAPLSGEEQKEDREQTDHSPHLRLERLEDSPCQPVEEE